VRCGAGQSEAERSGATARPKGFVEQLELEALSLLMEMRKGTPLQPLQLVAFHHSMYLTNLATINVLS
jgi:hypothetical protein